MCTYPSVYIYHFVFIIITCLKSISILQPPLFNILWPLSGRKNIWLLSQPKPNQAWNKTRKCGKCIWQYYVIIVAHCMMRYNAQFVTPVMRGGDRLPCDGPSHSAIREHLPGNNAANKPWLNQEIRTPSMRGEWIVVMRGLFVIRLVCHCVRILITIDIVG